MATNPDPESTPTPEAPESATAADPGATVDADDLVTDPGDADEIG